MTGRDSREMSNTELKINSMLTHLEFSLRARQAAPALLLGLLASLAYADPPTNLDPIPSYYEEAGDHDERDDVVQHATESVDPFTGKLRLSYVDMILPGNGGQDIVVQRSYTSGDGFLRDPGPFGIGWSMGFGRILRTDRVSFART